MTPEQYIEELQGDITDLRTELADAHHVLGLTELARRELEAELAAWKRHGVKVTEDCETCEGSGEKPCDASIHKLDKDGIESHPCPDCGGTRKKLRDGVGALFIELGGEFRDAYAFPAEWLEAE